MKKEDKYGVYGLLLMIVSGICYILIPIEGLYLIPLTLLFAIATFSNVQWISRAQKEVQRKEKNNG